MRLEYDETRRAWSYLTLSCLSEIECKRLNYHTHPVTTSTYRPHAKINIDTLVLNQPDRHGNIAIIVVIDTFTRWIELYPTPDYTVEVTTMKIFEHFGRYGPPTEILTDWGAQFVNKLVGIVRATYGVTFSKTPIAHSHENNAKVETEPSKSYEVSARSSLKNVLWKTRVEHSLRYNTF